MEYKSVNVIMTQELFDRSIKGTPKDAIKELIWNSCDADANKIEVKYNFIGFEGREVLEEVVVKDDGCGIPFDKAEEYFGKYGVSLKTHKAKSFNGRAFHGKLGQGRYKGFVIGTNIIWKTIYRDNDNKYYTYEIVLNEHNKRNILLSDSPSLSSNTQTGTSVYINGILDGESQSIKSLSDNMEVVPDLLATFAPYLLAYKGITINYNGVIINPEKNILSEDEKIVSCEEDGKQIDAKIIVIRWKNSKLNKFYICGCDGIVYEEKDQNFFNANNISVYLTSQYFDELHTNNTIGFGACKPAYDFLFKETFIFVKELIKSKDQDYAAEEVKKIKELGAYPFYDDPVDEIEKAKQNTFDILAVEVNRAVPQLKTSNAQTKKLTYRLIKEAIDTNPSSIKTILTEVFSLSKEQQDDLAELLSRAHLPEIINTSKVISDRLSFLYILEQMVYKDELGKPIKERSQFHKVLLNELWVFGDKYSLGTSDQSLKNLLVQHVKYLGRDELIPIIPKEAEVNFSLIPDICLFSQGCDRFERYEHLVVELKRPTYKLTMKELNQISEYSNAVCMSPAFDKATTKWHFILIGHSFNEDVIYALKNNTQGEGNYYNSDCSSISVLKWSTIIQNNKFKYEFLKSKLNHRLSDDPSFAMNYLMSKHADIFGNK